TAAGVGALQKNTTGQKNAAFGLKALLSNTTGASNTALGFGAGLNVTTGSNNIEIGSSGSANDNKVIRVGTQGTQTSTFIAGISGSPVTGADVVVNAAGKLGVVASSARYKRDITTMGAASDRLMKLRPVTFKYQNDSQGTTQYGLVAEEVQSIYPELVTYDANGRIETVRYSMLTSMLLNELQKQSAELREQAREIARQSSELRAQAAQLKASSTNGGEAEVARLSAELSSMRRQLQSLDASFAGRLTALERKSAASRNDQLASTLAR